MDTLSLIGLSVGLGLFGFIEPCSIGSHLLFIKYLEGAGPSAKFTQTLIFTLTRALFIGAMGALAALIGQVFLNLQQGFWILLGAVYILLGLTYLLGKQWALMRTFGPKLGGVRKARSAAALGIVFGLNIPACAAPLLGAVLGASVGASTVGSGFLTMALFGIALSLPLMLAVFWQRARGWLDTLASLSQKLPFWTGLLFIVLGVWSIYWAI